MSTLATTLTEINVNIYIYAGITVVALGTIGNIFTILIYSQNPLRSTRIAPLIILLAILNTIFLNGNIIPRTTVSIWRQTDTAFGQDIVCRLRSLILWSCVTITMLISSWLAIDRYLCSCREVWRRQWSSNRVLRIVTTIVIIFALAMNSPYTVYCRLTFNPISRTTFCTIINPTLVQFYTYFQVSVINTTLPVVVMALFGFLTIRNIRTVKQTSSHLERQMTRVLALQTIVNALTLMPYCIQTLYGVITTYDVKTTLNRAIENLSFVIILHVYYLLFGSNFYISLIASKEARETFKRLILLRRGNAVHTLSLTQTSRLAQTTV